MMQAFRTENNYRNASRLSAAELRAAMASREILQSTALAFDTQRQLRFELGGCRAVMPFGQCADGADTGSVRDIAVLTRVGRPTCFVIEGIDRSKAALIVTRNPDAICRALGYRRSVGQGVLYSAADIYFSAITPSATGGQPASAVLMMRSGIPAAPTAVALLINLVLYTLSILLMAAAGLALHPEIRR